MSSVPHPAGSDGDWQAEHNARLARGEFDDGEPQARDNVVDPRDPFANPPQYIPEALPDIFEEWVTTKIAEWGGDRGVYASAFIAMHCSVLSDTVKMQTNPGVDVWKAPNDFSLILGKTGQNKSGAWKDITQNQRGWQEAMSRSNAKQVRNKRAHVEMSFLQATTIEGMMAQIADNKGGRLVVGSQEMMTFYGSAAAHRKEDAISQMAHTVCAVYDGDSYNKRLVNKTYSIPAALATIIGATTLDSVMKWKGLETLISSGFMARHTIGIMGNNETQDKSKVVPGALDKHAEIMIKMRALTNVNLVLSDEATEKWEAYKVKKEAQIAHMDDTDVNEGLLAWDRKYQMRIMSAASIIQLYEFIEGGQKDCEESVLAMTEADLDKMDASETKVLRTIRISEESLRRAVKLVMGYLRRAQEHFYGVATGVTEFSKELVGFVAKRLTEDDPADPSSRHILRRELANNGPTRLRWGSIEERRDKACRYIRCLLENGYIEVYEPPNQRKMMKFKQEWEMPHYKMTDAFFQFFEPHRLWFSAHHRERMETMKKNLAKMSMEDL